jgi:DNA-directed RNA polymerase beta subunit
MIKDFMPVLANQVELDIDMLILLKVISYNPEALVQMKKIIWEGTDDWDTLLLKRAAVSGELVSDFTKEALNQFKNKEKCYCSSCKRIKIEKILKRKRQQLLMKERLLIPLFHRFWWIGSMLPPKKRHKRLIFHSNLQPKLK